MSRKRLYIMSPAEHALFTSACNPPALIVVRRGLPPAWNKYAKAQEFWEAMGVIHGFDWETVEPCEGMHVAFYRATPLEVQREG
jgi:hypothetical protein